ncbi:hypothetical protein FPRO04_13321 [Fusarium proliferatum]|nr:hypothetical protein FPRO04_13321 [Fusarium proliferatum]
MSNEHGRRLSKRLAAAAATDYEHDDDFAFVRKSKRIKTDKTDEPKPEAVPEPKAEPVKKSAKGRPAAKQHAAKAPTTNGTIVEEGPPEKETNTMTKPATRKTEGLTEPRRMKQLLTWCGERALAGKPLHGTPNSNAILGARAIQDQLLKDFAARSEFSDWFSREDDAPKVPVVLRPNPRNMELDEKLAQLEINIKRLQDEKKAWQAIRKPPTEQPPLFSEGETGPIVLPDFDLLDPDEGKIRGFLADETASFDTIRSQTESRLRTIQSSLQFQVDQLAYNVHRLEQRVLVAGKEANNVLSVSALRLRQREEREKASAGTRDVPVIEVLRSLGNIRPEGGG